MVTLRMIGDLLRVGRDRWARFDDVFAASLKDDSLEVGRTGPVRREYLRSANVLTAHRAGAPYLRKLLPVLNKLSSTRWTLLQGERARHVVRGGPSGPALPWFRGALTLFALIATAHAAEPLAWLPPGLPALPSEGAALCPRDYLTEAQGKAVLDAALEEFSTKEKWEAYATLLRERVQAGAGLAPWPQRTPLNPIVHSRREYDGYSVENVAFESIPGYFVCGNLYRPLHTKGPLPAVLTTHGHTGPIKTEADWAKHGRFTETVQLRSATLARMGAVVLAIEMFGYGDSTEQLGPDAHRTAAAMPMQIWNAMRAVDLLVSLPGVDAKRIAVTGESGGGTQAFLLSGLDARIRLSVPVVMVSSYFFGGCPCESGRPIHRSPDHFASNAMLAALTAPRPMHVVSVGGDWSKNTPTVEFPFLQAIYAVEGKSKNVTNDHYVAEGHNYGPSKRQSMYRVMSMRLGLDAKPVRAEDGSFSEAGVTLETPAQLRTWNAAQPLPAHALRSVDAVMTALNQLQTQ